MAISTEQIVAFIKKNPVGVGCGVLSLVILGGLYYRSGSLDAITVEAQDRSDTRDKFRGNVINSTGLQEQYDALLAANKTIQGRLIRSVARFENQRYFTELAAAAGATLLNQNPQTAEPKTASKGGFVQVPFQVAVQGKYSQVMDFLHRVEYGEHYARVLSTSISKAQGEKEPDAVTLNVNLELLGRP